MIIAIVFLALLWVGLLIWFFKYRETFPNLFPTSSYEDRLSTTEELNEPQSQFRSHRSSSNEGFAQDWEKIAMDWEKVLGTQPYHQLVLHDEDINHIGGSGKVIMIQGNIDGENVLIIKKAHE